MVGRVIFGELMSRKPLFAGNDYIHQLKIICDVVGSPTEHDWLHHKLKSPTVHARNAEESQSPVE